MDIDKDLIEKIVRENIENQLEDFDFTYLFRDELRPLLQNKANKIIDEKLKEEIENVLNKEIDTDNGWGKRKHWDSFEDMFKSKFNEKMNSDWDMKRTIEKTVENRIDELLKKKTKEITIKIQDMVLNELIESEE